MGTVIEDIIIKEYKTIEQQPCALSCSNDVVIKYFSIEGIIVSIYFITPDTDHLIWKIKNKIFCQFIGHTWNNNFIKSQVI